MTPDKQLCEQVYDDANGTHPEYYTALLDAARAIRSEP